MVKAENHKTNISIKSRISVVLRNLHVVHVIGNGCPSGRRGTSELAVAARVAFESAPTASVGYACVCMTRVLILGLSLAQSFGHIREKEACGAQFTSDASSGKTPVLALSKQERFNVLVQAAARENEGAIRRPLRPAEEEKKELPEQRAKLCLQVSKTSPPPHTYYSFFLRNTGWGWSLGGLEF